jgi:acetyl-CoA acyltransferase
VNRGLTEAWVVGAARTPIGRHGGSLSAVRPDDLGAVVLGALMERTGIEPGEVEDVYMGCANQAGEDNRDVARMSLLLAGFPETVAGATVNRLCGSGLEAVAQAARSVMLGEAEAYVGGGVESMSRAPWAVPKPERAFPTGNATMYDTTLGWRFVNPRMEEMGHTDALGMTAENLAQERFQITPDEDRPEGFAEEYHVSREAQDRFALRSHEKAVAAQDGKRFREEIVPVTAKTRRSETVVEADEGPRRDTTLEKLAKLRPAFREGGSVTAGNSSGITDGAAAMLLMGESRAKAEGRRPLARIVGTSWAGVDPRIMGIGPVPATKKVLEQTGLSLADIDAIEINEAFAAQVIACERELKVDRDKLNSKGGGISIGHPIGMSGARVLLTLAYELRDRGLSLGLATLCISGGQGLAVVLERA